MAYAQELSTRMHFTSGQYKFPSFEHKKYSNYQYYIAASVVNEWRTMRVAEILEDFRTLQYYIADTPAEPLHADDHHTEGWAALRQCHIDGQTILDTGADTTVPMAGGGEEEQRKAELKQRHEGQKIFLRQQAAQRWVEWRESVLQGERPNKFNQAQLLACDHQLRAELATITDDAVYADLKSSDVTMGRWTAEDPSLSAVMRWVRSRR